MRCFIDAISGRTLIICSRSHAIGACLSKCPKYSLLVGHSVLRWLASDLLLYIISSMIADNQINLCTSCRWLCGFLTSVECLLSEKLSEAQKKERPEWRPLYLDLQATTPMVSFESCESVFIRPTAIHWKCSKIGWLLHECPYVPSSVYPSREWIVRKLEHGHKFRQLSWGIK